jgi:hypothetical protein
MIEAQRLVGNRTGRLEGSNPSSQGVTNLPEWRNNRLISVETWASWLVW